MYGTYCTPQDEEACLPAAPPLWAGDARVSVHPLGDPQRLL